ncbi:MAG: amidohydrolase family protein [Planctomycetota bacterium]
MIAGASLVFALAALCSDAAASLSAPSGATATGAAAVERADAGAVGAPRGLAVRSAKALALPFEGQQVIDDAVMLVRNGRIERIGRAADVEIPEGYEVLDLGERWIAPGMIDLHCHVAAKSFFVNDLNDMVYLTNPGLRASTSVVPGNGDFRRAVAAGVTGVLYIPGSGTNIGGQGVLLKTGHEDYARMELRNPGSLKLAQAGNPESFLMGVGRALMNWNTRATFVHGLAYAASFARGELAAKDPQWEVFRDLAAKRTQVSTHTQIYQVVLQTVTMVREQLGLDVYIDHGSFDGWRVAQKAWDAGVPAILGPRAVSVSLNIEYRPGMFIVNDNDGRIYGMAERYQAAGHGQIGFNTDSPVIPQEELPLQAAMASRYGFDTRNVDHVRGLTIVPAKTAGLGDRLGSLEAGKDADFIVCDGDPADPRTTISITFQDGERVYDDSRELRRW